MGKSEFESQLSAVEAQLAFLHQSSIGADPMAVADALTTLQTSLLSLAGLGRQLATGYKRDAKLHSRLKKSAAMLSSLREGLLRQQVGVERALSALVPNFKSVTYGAQGLRGRAQPYGGVARQSGEFRMVSV